MARSLLLHSKREAPTRRSPIQERMPIRRSRRQEKTMIDFSRSRILRTTILATVVALGVGCKFSGLDGAGTYDDGFGTTLVVENGDSFGTCTAELHAASPGPEYPDGVVWPAQACSFYLGQLDFFGSTITAKFMELSLDSDDLPPELMEGMEPFQENWVLVAYAESPFAAKVQNWLLYSVADDVLWDPWSILYPGFTRVPGS